MFEDGDGHVLSLPGAPDLMSGIPGPNLYLLLVCFSLDFWEENSRCEGSVGVFSTLEILWSIC